MEKTFAGVNPKISRFETEDSGLFPQIREGILQFFSSKKSLMYPSKGICLNGWVVSSGSRIHQKAASLKKKGGGKNIALGRPRYKRLNAGKYIQENFLLPPYDLFKCKHGHRASKHTSRDERLKIRAFFEEEPISQGVQKTVWECNAGGCIFLKFLCGNANVCVGRLFFCGKKRRRIIMVKVIHG